MRIGELSRRTGASERSLRYYEQQELLRPARLPSGYRVYDDDAVRTVRDIRTLLSAGLNTATISEVLPCLLRDGEVLAPACVGLADVLRRDRARITNAVEDLLAARDVLDAILAAATRVDPADEREACWSPAG